MSIRSEMVRWANYWADPGEYRVWPEELIEFFRGAGCEQLPSERDAQESMTLSTGVRVGGHYEKGKWVPGTIKHWCGIFACYILRYHCGVTGVKWSLVKGRLVPDNVAVTYHTGVAGIQPGDIAVIPKGQHHFIIADVNTSGNQLISIDGNAGNQSVKRRTKYIKSTVSDQNIYGYYKVT